MYQTSRKNKGIEVYEEPRNISMISVLPCIKVKSTAQWRILWSYDESLWTTATAVSFTSNPADYASSCPSKPQSCFPRPWPFSKYKPPPDLLTWAKLSTLHKVSPELSGTVSMHGWRSCLRLPGNWTGCMITHYHPLVHIIVAPFLLHTLSSFMARCRAMPDTFLGRL